MDWLMCCGENIIPFILMVIYLSGGQLCHHFSVTFLPELISVSNQNEG